MNEVDKRVYSDEGDNLNVTVVNIGDGTNTMTLYDYPVKFVNDSGEIEDISLEVTAADNGSFKTKANSIQTVFPKKITDGISMTYEDISIRLTPDLSMTAPLLSLVESEQQAISQAAAEPVASGVNVNRLDNETVWYYYNNNTRFEYSLTYLGFKEDIVVSEYTGQTEYSFLLETGGLTLTQSGESYILVDKNGKTKATVGDIVILTADGGNDTTGYMTYVEIKANERYRREFLPKYLQMLFGANRAILYIVLIVQVFL